MTTTWVATRPLRDAARRGAITTTVNCPWLSVVLTTEIGRSLANVTSVRTGVRAV